MTEVDRLLTETRQHLAAAARYTRVTRLAVAVTVLAVVVNVVLRITGVY